MSADISHYQEQRPRWLDYWLGHKPERLGEYACRERLAGFGLDLHRLLYGYRTEDGEWLPVKYLIHAPQPGRDAFNTFPDWHGGEPILAAYNLYMVQVYLALCEKAMQVDQANILIDMTADRARAIFRGDDGAIIEVVDAGCEQGGVA